MAEIQASEVSFRRFDIAATLIISAAVLAIAYMCDRAYRRWVDRLVRENRPLARSRARVEGLRTRYQGRRADVTEVAHIISGALEAVRSASREARAPRP